MKRLLITIILFLLGIGCGFGAFFMLKTGTDIKQERNRMYSYYRFYWEYQQLQSVYAFIHLEKIGKERIEYDG